MEDIDKAFREADQGGVRLELATDRLAAVRGEAVLFDAVQVPLVALSVIACIASRRGGESVHSLGARVGRTLMAAFPAFSRTGRYLQWSIRVRAVTADAVAFLEQSALVAVEKGGHRTATLTDAGRRFLRKVRASEGAGKLFTALSSAVLRTQDDELKLV